MAGFLCDKVAIFPVVVGFVFGAFCSDTLGALSRATVEPLMVYMRENLTVEKLTRSKTHGLKTG